MTEIDEAVGGTKRATETADRVGEVAEYVPALPLAMFGMILVCAKPTTYCARRPNCHVP
jgi:hypothetical protein